MPLFLWKKSYEIGISEIDAQHRRLVGIINELSDAMMIKEGYRTVPHVLEQLVDYTQLHFTTEENHMREINYPALDEHRQEHLDLTKRVLGFKKNYATGHDPDIKGLLFFLCDWLKNHIVTSDKKIREYLQHSEKERIELDR